MPSLEGAVRQLARYSMTARWHIEQGVKEVDPIYRKHVAASEARLEREMTRRRERFVACFNRARTDDEREAVLERDSVVGTVALRRHNRRCLVELVKAFRRRPARLPSHRLSSPPRIPGAITFTDGGRPRSGRSGRPADSASAKRRFVLAINAAMDAQPDLSVLRLIAQAHEAVEELNANRAEHGKEPLRSPSSLKARYYAWHRALLT